jgi:hypothetical protein
MSESKIQEPTSDFFVSLVENAIEFLKTVSCQLKASPKHSLINFAAAAELFLKARLLAEHWSLVVDKPGEANLESFRRGEFRSVGPEEAIRRLENIVGEPLTSDEKNCFKELRNHRNKLVHFFHPRYAKPEQSTVDEVVSKQLRAWFYLRRLLTQRWQKQFERFVKQIESLDKLLQKNRSYLQGKFLALKPEIDKAKEEGTEFLSCERCGYEAARLGEISEPLFECKCFVCEAEQRCLRVECPRCSALIIIDDLAEGVCSCNQEIGLDDLLETYGPYEDPKEDPKVVYCAACERPDRPTVIPFGDCYTPHGFS